MPPKRGRQSKATEVSDKPAVRHNYQEIYDQHFVELKQDALLAECWFGDNPRGDENDGGGCKALLRPARQAPGRASDALGEAPIKAPKTLRTSPEEVSALPLCASLRFNINVRTVATSCYFKEKCLFVSLLALMSKRGQLAVISRKSAFLSRFSH